MMERQNPRRVNPPEQWARYEETHAKGTLTWSDLPVEWRPNACYWKRRDHGDPAGYTMEQLRTFEQRSADCPLCIHPADPEHLYAEVSIQLEAVTSHFDGLTEQNTGTRPRHEKGQYGGWVVTRTQLEELLADNPAPRAWLERNADGINLTVTDGG